jgi:hypothetical protein
MFVKAGPDSGQSAIRRESRRRDRCQQQAHDTARRKPACASGGHADRLFPERMTMSGQHDSAADLPQERRAPISRRTALRGGAAAGVAGAALLAAGTPAFAASLDTQASAKHAGRTEATDAGSHAEPVVVHLRDARTGEIDIFRGTTETRVHDRALAAALLRASR